MFYQYYYFQGEVIIAEDPILFLKNDDENMIASLDYQFESLSAENQKRVIALHDPDPSGDMDQKLIRIFKINCIEGWSSQRWPKKWPKNYTNKEKLNISL